MYDHNIKKVSLSLSVQCCIQATGFVHKPYEGKLGVKFNSRQEVRQGHWGPK